MKVEREKVMNKLNGEIDEDKKWVFKIYNCVYIAIKKMHNLINKKIKKEK